MAGPAVYIIVCVEPTCVHFQTRCPVRQLPGGSAGGFPLAKGRLVFHGGAGPPTIMSLARRRPQFSETLERTTKRAPTANAIPRRKSPFVIWILKFSLSRPAAFSFR